MKYQLSLLFFLFAGLMSAQEYIEKNLGDFKELKVFDLLNVEMIASSENKVIVKGQEPRDVQFINKNGTLKIRMNTENVFNGEQTFISLFYKSVEVIDANEGAKVLIKSPIDQYEIDLKAQEGAEIEAQIEVSYASIKAVTGGIITTKGKASNQDVNLRTGAVYNGKNLETEFSDVRLQAGGEVYVNCKERLEIIIKAGGDVFIYGNPWLVDEKRILGGRVKRVE